MDIIIIRQPTEAGGLRLGLRVNPPPDGRGHIASFLEMASVLDLDIVILEYLTNQFDGSCSGRHGGYGDLEYIPSTCGRQLI